MPQFDVAGVCMIMLLLIAPHITASVRQPELRCADIRSYLRSIRRIDRLSETGRHEDFDLFLLVANRPLVQAALHTIVGGVLAEYERLTKLIVIMLPAVNGPHIDLEEISDFLIGCTE